ncbi:hypothetical protein NPIL_15701 [Nephila pilipes]|uniref:Uncharacterized protein n=1 Tax=Nephila pilipes TaxID=299642 RepID=A0A8X6PXA8_NEPPI|nr:hypothetical protein NPIL_15701 [Nephila pilipes]
MGYKNFCRICGRIRLVSVKQVQNFHTFQGRSMKRYQSGAKKRKKFKRKLEIAESQKNALHKFLGSTTSVPSSSTSDNPQCTSTSNIFPEASTSEVRPFIPPDSEQNKGDDSEKGDNEEVQSNNESNRDRESEEDKDDQKDLSILMLRC